MFNKSKPHENGAPGALGIPSPPETPRPSDPYRPAEPARVAPASSGGTGVRSTNLSTLSAGVNYEGNVTGGGDLQIDGKLKGDVRVSRVLIGEGGAVEGGVTADVIEVRGRISGTLSGKSVKLYATARVEGDITQEQLSIEQGAWFQGRCMQAKRDAAPTAAAPLAIPATPAADRYQPEKPVAPALPGAKAEMKPVG